jgi:Tol biopolymer transport system component
MRRFAEGISRLLLVTVLVPLAVVGGVRSVAAGPTTRVSVDSLGRQADGPSSSAAISANGRFVAFESDATNLVAGETNHFTDVFVYDLTTGKTTRVSVDSAGRQANGPSSSAAISADGRFVAFESDATNLVVGDTNGKRDVFVHDLVTRTTSRVSVDSVERQANSPSFGPVISADGRYVAFESAATNLVPGDTNGLSDIFVRDLMAGTTTRVSVDSAGRQANGPSYRPAISADGRYIAFESAATGLVPGDTNGLSDIFVRDLMTGKTTRVSVDSLGRQANGPSYSPAVSADGRFVAFESDASNLVPGDSNLRRDVFVRDLMAGTTTRASVDSAGRQANGSSSGASISGDGRFVVFDSDAFNLVPNDTNGKRDVFVHDLR